MFELGGADHTDCRVASSSVVDSLDSAPDGELGGCFGWPKVPYLCAVRDGCSRRVIGWAIDEYLHTDLVEAALAMAVAMRGKLADAVILHADRGCRPRFKGSSQHRLIEPIVDGR
jgi:transposase InsO family protein